MTSKRLENVSWCQKYVRTWKSLSWSHTYQSCNLYLKHQKLFLFAFVLGIFWIWHFYNVSFSNYWWLCFLDIFIYLDLTFEQYMWYFSTIHISFPAIMKSKQLVVFKMSNTILIRLHFKTILSSIWYFYDVLFQSYWQLCVFQFFFDFDLYTWYFLNFVAISPHLTKFIRLLSEVGLLPDYPANIRSQAIPELSGHYPKPGFSLAIRQTSEAGLLPDYPTTIRSRAIPGLSSDFPKSGFSRTMRLLSEVELPLTPETAHSLSTKAKTYIF